MPQLQRRPLAERAAPLDPLAFLRASFERFLQPGVDPERREDLGLQRVLRSVFPIRSPDGLSTLEFVSYALERPRYDTEASLRRGMTYASPLKCVVRLIVWDVGEDGARFIRDIKEQEVYCGEVPLMTTRGTLIADGREVVLVPSLRPRAGLELRPGAAGLEARLHDLYGNVLSLVREAGAVTVSLELAEGMPAQALLRARPGVHTLRLDDDGLQLTLGRLPGRKLVARQDLLDGTGKVVVRAGRGLTATTYGRLREQGPLTLALTPRDASALRLSAPAHGADGQVVAGAGTSLRQATLRALAERGVRSLQVEFDDEKPEAPAPTRCEDDEAVGQWLESHLEGFEVGPDARVGLALGLTEDACAPHGMVYPADLQLIASRLRDLQAGPASEPQLCRVWAAGEALEQAAWVGCRLVAAEVAERMAAASDVETLMPHDLLNARPLARSFRFLLESKARTAPADDLQPLALLEQLRTLELRGLDAPAGWPRSERGVRLPLEVEPDATGTVATQLAGPATPIAEALLPLGADSSEAARRAGEALAQGLPPAEPEPPRVATGAEAAIARATGEVSCAHADGDLVALGPELWAVFPGAQLDPGVHVLPAPHNNRGVSMPAPTLPASGRRLAKGEAFAAGPGTSGTELALGHNLRVAFDPSLRGITLSASVVESGRFATLRLRLLECVARDTRLGKEEITAGIPGLVAPLLDESGIARLGAEVRPGDVLVGKGTPLEQPARAPVEGERWPVTDSSLRASADDAGIVRHVDIFARPGTERSARHAELTQARLHAWQELVRQAEERSWRSLRAVVLARWSGAALAGKLVTDTGEVLAQAGDALSEQLLTRLPDNLLYALPLGPDAEAELSQLLGEREGALEALRSRAYDEESQTRRGEELPPGVVSVVRVALEALQPISVGDRLTDRHGFSARIERIAPEAEMPRLPDGRALEALLPWLDSGPAPGALAELRLGAAAEARGLWLEVPARPVPDDRAIRDFCGDAAPYAELPTGLLYLVRLPAS